MQLTSKKPKYMPNWLYQYFGKYIRPMIHQKGGWNLLKPPTFTQNSPHTQPTFWIHPPEPSFSLASHQFEPVSSIALVFFFGYPTSLLRNYSVQSVRIVLWNRMEHFIHTESLIWRTHSILLHGIITVDKDLIHILLVGTKASLLVFQHIYISHFLLSFPIKVGYPIV